MKHQNIATDSWRARADRGATGHESGQEGRLTEADEPLRIHLDPVTPNAPSGSHGRQDGPLRIALDPDDRNGRPLNRDAHGPKGPLRIAVDFDGVLFDHVPYILRGFRDAHGIDLEAEGLRYWDFFQYRSVREKNLTWRCVGEILEQIDTDPVFHDQPCRDPHTRGVMQRWRDAGHEVRIVTAREERSREVTEAFLKRNDVPYDELVMNARIKTGHDVLVDDAPHNVLMAAAAGGLALLMDQPYNRDVPTERNPLRVLHWRDVENCVAQHARKVAA